MLKDRHRGGGGGGECQSRKEEVEVFCMCVLWDCSKSCSVGKITSKFKIRRKKIMRERMGMRKDIGEG